MGHHQVQTSSEPFMVGLTQDSGGVPGDTVPHWPAASAINSLATVRRNIGQSGFLRLRLPASTDGLFSENCGQEAALELLVSPPGASKGPGRSISRLPLARMSGLGRCLCSRERSVILHSNCSCRTCTLDVSSLNAVGAQSGNDDSTHLSLLVGRLTILICLGPASLAKRRIPPST